MAERDPVEALRDAVRALPESVPLRRELAAALSRQGRHREALGELEAALDRSPRDAAALLDAARCLSELERFGEALERYQEAVAADPRLADAVVHERLRKAAAEPRARLRVLAGGSSADPRPDLGPSVAGAGDRGPITFADVGGLEELKEKVRLRVIYPLQRPELFAAYGRTPGGGVLFYGPPGCGKTHLARATAGEAGLRFLPVGVDDVLDMWLGQSERRLADWFRRARAEAPAILFFDEVDALGGRRSGLRHESYRTLVTQFLAELDGAGESATARGPGRPGLEGVLVLGATNAPWDVDPAFRRPGRFGEVLFVPPPDLRARVQILELRLRGKPQEEIDLLEVARRTELYSGADLGQVVERAAEAALGAALRAGRVQPLTTAALLTAAASVRPSTREWFAAAKNFVAYGNEAGQYDEVAEYIARHLPG